MLAAINWHETLEKFPLVGAVKCSIEIEYD
jgi:hypothetical protein